MIILINFNDVVKPVEFDSELYDLNNILENMQEIAEEYDIEDDKEFKRQMSAKEKIFDNLLISEIEKNFRKVYRKNFEANVYYPKPADIENGVSLRIRAKDHNGNLGLGFTDEEFDLVIEYINKMKDGN